MQAVLTLEFTRPEWLWTLAAMPILALVAIRSVRSREQGWKRLGKTPVRGREGDRRWLIALSLLAIAAAGPRWNWREAPGEATGQDVVLVVDTSRSMGVADALPNRMGTAVASAESLIRSIGTEEGSRVGVVAFAGRGVVRCPLTENLGVASDALKALRPGDVRPGGTNLAAGVGVALELLAKSDQKVPRTIVLFSDGEDLTGSWPALVARLRQEKVTLHGVAIGDVKVGHPIPAPGGKPLRFNGKVVESRRNDTPIEALAAATGGSMVRPGLAPVDLAILFERRMQPLAVGRRKELRRETERADRHLPFLLAAFVVGVSTCRPGRFRAAWAVGLLLLLAPGASLGARSTAAWIREGKAAYDRHDLETARTLFLQALRNDPLSDIALYDAAATAFQAGRFEEALSVYDRSLRLTRQPGLRMKIQYAVGNTNVALGRREEAIRSYEACIASKVKGPRYDAIRRDAAINKRFAEAPPPTYAEPRNDGRKDGDRPDGEKDPEGGENPSPKPEDSDQPGDSSETPPSGSDATSAADEAPEPRSARERFQDALDNARQARDFRTSDEGPPPRQGEVLKDW